VNWDEYTRLYGKHSNIPDCCIEAFTAGKTVVDYSLKYGRCEACRAADRRAEIHFCTVECIPFLQSIGLDPLKFSFKGKISADLHKSKSTCQPAV